MNFQRGAAFEREPIPGADFQHIVLHHGFNVLQQVFICFHPHAVTGALGKVNIVFTVAADAGEIANRAVFAACIAIAFYAFTAYETARNKGHYQKKKE
jgi:hypothetical protein